MKQSLLFFCVAAAFLAFGLGINNRDIDPNAGMFSLALESIGVIFFVIGVQRLFKHLFQYLHSKGSTQPVPERPWKPWKDYFWLGLSTLFLILGLWALSPSVGSGYGGFVSFPIGLFVTFLSSASLIGTIQTILVKRKKFLGGRKIHR